MVNNDSTFIPVVWKTNVHIGYPTDFSIKDSTVFKPPFMHTEVAPKKSNPFEEYLSLKKIIICDYVFLAMFIFMVIIGFMIGWTGFKAYGELK